MKAIESRKHHYVPQMLLRNFAVEGRETLYAFDKVQLAHFSVAVKDAAAEKGYNTFETEKGLSCAEEVFTDIETSAAEIIRRILTERRLPTLSKPDKNVLAKLVISQIIRSVNYRAISEHVGDVLRELASREGTEEFRDWVGEKNPAEEKRLVLENIERMIQELLPCLIDKDVVLFSAPEDSPFLIGDSPAVRTNTLTIDESVGTLGLASTGVEIYLPLSPSVTLGMMCRSLNEVTRQAIFRLGKNATEFSVSYQAALHFGRVIAMGKENVDFNNSLQISSAERFVYSKSGDFRLAEEMIERDSTLRQGVRMKMNQPLRNLV